MTYLGRRFFVAVLLLVLVALASGGTQLARVPRVARAAGTETFTSATPAKLYAGIPSHLADADADPAAGGTTGYCVSVVNEGHAAAGGNNGFTIVNGTILSTSVFTNATATNTDDRYCAVVQGTVPTTTARPPLVLRWTWTDTPQNAFVELTVPLVYVTLKGTDGVVGGTAQVCTVGWDPTFLTGAASNTPPTVPNALDVVSLADWTVLSPTGVTKVGVLKQGAEQCLLLSATTPKPDIDVKLDFYSVADVSIVADDRLLSATGTDVVSITNATAPELRHITVDGLVATEQAANPNVIGALHSACVIPSVPGDTMLASDISFQSPDGATVSALQVFSSIGLQGAPDGTKCFSWTSTSPGTQAVSARFTASTANPANTSGFPKVFNVSWDTNGDGNGGTVAIGGQLIKTWNRIQRTVITTGGDPTAGAVTYGAIPLPVELNVADGSFLGSITLNEFVIGVRPGFEGPIDGVPVTLTIDGTCGYFEENLLRVLSGVTKDGRLQFTVKVDDDTGCNQASVIRVTATANYPATIPNGAAATETVDITLQFGTNGAGTESAQPQVLWAGQTATIVYSFTGDCQNAVARFTRSKGQPGQFLPGPGVLFSDADSATMGAGTTGCSFSILYESESPGTVDITATLESPDVPSARFSKSVFTIFYMAFEDLDLVVEPDLTVSEFGNLDATIRGWFLSPNPSGRAKTVMPDGRILPANRWILPDDWETLKGPEGFRATWGTIIMPPARITFFLKDEPLRNAYGGEKNGALGFLAPDDGLEFSFNVDPQSGTPSVLGSVQKPRILSEYTATDGIATVDTFGDLNLSFEECPPNAITRNPECRIGDVVGRTSYYARAEYPENLGKQSPIQSAYVSTTFTWAGYKQVTIVDDPDPNYKYVVAHLKDRDGFCNAINYNNTLGVPVQFLIDAGDGVIVEAQGQPSSISPNKRFATATTFDTQDDLGNPINTDIAKPAVSPDECQAWVKIANTFPTTVNVTVVFPAPPSPIPSALRITALTCGPAGSVTVTNTGAIPVSLAGFGIRSLRPGAGEHGNEEHLGLIGLLQPGQSATFPGAAGAGWYNAGPDPIFGNVGGDYARLIWEEYSISTATCDGRIINNEIPMPYRYLFPPDGEGEIQLDVIVPFGPTLPVRLAAGWNLVTAGTTRADIGSVLADDAVNVAGIYTWDANAGVWKRYGGSGSPLNTMEAFEPGAVYWVDVKRPFTLQLPR
ncbi:MAG: hypothetical protein HYX53_00490 [Chloroflexi bacterium]|nr:hypothetical protein [Chloroflexota bacterium]